MKEPAHYSISLPPWQAETGSRRKSVVEQDGVTQLACCIALKTVGKV